MNGELTGKDLAVARVMVRLDDKLWNMYCPDNPGSTSGRTLENAHVWLQNDIKSILADSEDVREMADQICAVIRKEYYGQEVLSRYIHMDRLQEEVNERNEVVGDFPAALKRVRYGYQLSPALRYCFSKDELIELGDLHRSGRFRKKIEELLTDCNFHSECGFLAKKRYSEFVMFVKEER